MNTCHVRNPAPRQTRPTRAARRLGALAAVLLLAGCGAAPLREPVAGYTCCNLRAVGGWISSDNVLGGVLVPAGEPVKFESRRSSDRVYGTIGGRDVGFHHDWGRTADETLQMALRLVVARDPREQLVKWPADIRAAVDAAQVIPGMTRAQVTMAIGHPARRDTPDTAADTWRYRTMDHGTVDLRFGPDGKLFEVVGSAAAVAMVQSTPASQAAPPARSQAGSQAQPQAPSQVQSATERLKEDTPRATLASLSQQKEERALRQQ